MNITMDSVSKIIGNTTVMDNVTLQLNSECVYGFQGINGSGKTMLMRLISGLIYPSKGYISINGQVLGKDYNFPDSMGLLIENPAFLPSYSGFQNLKLLASIKSTISDDSIRSALYRVGLDPDEKKKYRKYSLGMKQRLGIACAIMECPDLIILDEPTNSLDESGIKMLRQLVLEERERGALIVISCHDYKILSSIVNHIYVIENGRIVNHQVKNENADFIEVSK